MVRILFQNPQGLGRLSANVTTQTSKLYKLKETLLKHNIDILGLVEVNKDWRLVPQQNTFWAITEGWFEHRRLSTCNNRQVPAITTTQYGGTLLMMMNRVAYGVMATEDDERGLGRWTSMLLNGKNQSKCRIICAYCPCISNGVSSTYALQVVGLSKASLVECPRKQFWSDLKEYICCKQELGEKVIVMGDWNSEYDEVVHWINELGLHDVIHSRHTSTRPPPTCSRSRASPLDAIFVPETIPCWRGGYLSFGFLDGDHRGLWCDLPIEYILGYNMQHPAHPKARRLKTEDPRVRNKYLSLLNTSLTKDGVYVRMQRLFETAHKSWLPTDTLEF
jgi:Exonuclease III